jgi:hypothetical protein
LFCLVLVLTGAGSAILIGYLYGLPLNNDWWISAEHNSQVEERVQPRLTDLIGALATGAVGLDRSCEARYRRHNARRGCFHRARSATFCGGVDYTRTAQNLPSRTNKGKNAMGWFFAYILALEYLICKTIEDFLPTIVYMDQHHCITQIRCIVSHSGSKCPMEKDDHPGWRLPISRYRMQPSHEHPFANSGCWQMRSCWSNY